MSDEQAENQEFDPFVNMVEFYDNWTKSWANSMSETFTNERFAKTMAEQMEGSMEFMGLIRKQVSDAMTQYLQGINLPTRNEVIDLAERLNRIEMILDDLDAKTDEILDQIKNQKSR